LSNIYNNPENFYRKKSPERVIDEILSVKAQSSLHDIHFSDDLFIYPDNISWLKKFSKLCRKKIGIKYTCNLRPDYVNEETAKLLASSGCRAAAISVESGNEILRNNILNKKILDKQIINAVNCLKKNNIKILTFNMMSIPDEQITNIFETIEFNQKINPNYVRVNMLYPINNSDITRLVKYKNKYCIKKINNNIETQLASPLINSKNKVELQRLYYLFAFSIKAHLPIKILALKKLPLTKFYKLIWIIMSNYTEKAFFNINILKGFIYFIHTRGVSKRSENFTSIY
jgi:radical SAM superfamily enzyme YgiQ (UPF0313 family)